MGPQRMGEPRLTLAGNHCKVHGYHWPEPLRTVRHHILPEAEGGKATVDNLQDTCDTGHYNIHYLLELLEEGKPIVHLGTRKERAIAEEGWRRIQAKRAGNGRVHRQS